MNRFLLRESYEPRELFALVEKFINLQEGILSVGDTVIEKPYSHPKNTELIGYFWSGKYHRVIVGVNLIILDYQEESGKQVPVNYRIYDTQEAKMNIFEKW